MDEAVMVASGLLLANIDPRAGLPLALLWTILLLMAVILGSAVIIIVVGRWAKRPFSDSRSSGADLGSFRVLYERGELSQEDYDRIRARLGQKLRQELKVPGSKAGGDPVHAQPDGNEQAAGPDANPPPGRPDESSGGSDTSIKPAQ